jgi:ATP-dependent Lon protease
LRFATCCRSRWKRTASPPRSAHFKTALTHHSAVHAGSRVATTGARDWQNLSQGRARIAEGTKARSSFAEERVHEFLGAPKIIPEEVLKKDQIGVATGLAWTAVGGDVLFIEALRMKGKGNLVLTGNLARSCASRRRLLIPTPSRARKELDIAEEDFSNYDLHIHIPEGSDSEGRSIGRNHAGDRDGLSACRSATVRKDVAMTGEITLRGNVLPIGGVKEKVLAARRARVTTIILPQQNRRDLDEVPKEPFKDIRFVFVDNMRQVFARHFQLLARKSEKATFPRSRLRTLAKWTTGFSAVDNQRKTSTTS